MTKKVLKDIFDEKINKEDIYRYVTNKKRNNYYGVLKYAALIVVCIGIVLFSFKNNGFKDNNTYSDIDIYINEVKTFGNTDIDVTIMNINESTNIYFSDDLEEAYPFLKRSKSLYEKDDEILKNYETDIYFAITENDDENPFSKIHNLIYAYKNKDGKGKITVSFAKDKKPLRDYFFETKSSKQSSIKNKKVTIYKYENTYFTEFHDNGIYYDIESHNVNIKDFIKILELIIEDNV